ncbi:hypothetical protein [Nocardia cyriacigeorgica]|uniref:hypothetical protein n=1 Tax=Nocardia cyriacigeorgica TaxID=135487 RepID=UPI001E41A4DE|nr:hypothetical protein [Nocardia cyriacigeorgica]
MMLRAPAPLDVPLELRAGGLYDGATVIAETAPGAFERDVPEPVSFDDAGAASAAYRNDSEMFRYCFVCGTARQDGLGLGPGAVGAGMVATPWVPDDSLPVEPTLLWAAMDCPGGWALPEMLERPALLGSMTASVFALPAVGENASWSAPTRANRDANRSPPRPSTVPTAACSGGPNRSGSG